MGKILGRIAGILAWLCMAAGIFMCAAAAFGFFRFMAQVESGERLYDGMPMMGIFTAGAGGFLIAVMGLAAWAFRGRRSGYAFLLAGLLLSWFPVGLALSGLRASALLGAHMWLTAAGSVLLLLAVVFAGRTGRPVVSGADPAS